MDALHPPFGILNRLPDFERAAEILKFAFAKIHVHSSECYHCKAIYNSNSHLYPDSDTHVNSSVENTFSESL